MKKGLRYSLIIIAIALAATAVLRTAPEAQANFLGDFFKKFIAPFARESSTTVEVPQSGREDRTPAQGATNPTQLYKPVLDYEKAVVAAVKRASPAVVSITVSKNVPIIERCPVNPFRDLPPEFREFFGGLPQLSEPCERGSELREVGSGSGFIISSDGLILTNKHVVFDEKASYTVFTNDGKKYDARVLARDRSPRGDQTGDRRQD